MCRRIAQGLFSLEDSDHKVGSYISVPDASRILNVSADIFSCLEQTEVNGVLAIEEDTLAKNLREILGFNYKKKSSWDEYILKAIIEKIYPQAIVEQQIKVGRYSMDLKVTLGSKELFIEFDGPSHFAITRFGKPKDVWKKKATVESITGIEVVKWPYWIQRCEQNVKSLFNSDVKGYGALWSTKTLFGDFYFNDSADIICELNSRFNIPIEDISTFYSPGSDGRVIPEHPILQKIQKGNEPLSRLIPTGTKEGEIVLVR